MSRQQDDLENIQRYSQLVSEYGIDVRSLDWGSVESQQLRFRMLTEMAEVEGARILDVGCGLGDLYSWLRKHEKTVEYTGIDITPKMIELAQQRFPECKFLVSNIDSFSGKSSGDFDFVFASGIFCKRISEPFSFLKETVQAMFRACRTGVAFNSLSGWADEQDANEFHADPVDTLNFCRTLTPWVSLRHDYHARDFTIYMYRNRFK